MSYPAQVAWRASELERILREADLPGALPAIEVTPMEEPWAHRSKMEFTFGRQGTWITLGLHQRGSFRKVVDVARCEIAPPGSSELLEALREEVNRSGQPAYHPGSHQGFWRHAVVKANSSGDLLLLLVTQEGPAEPVERIAVALPSKVPALKSIYWGVTRRLSDVALHDRMTCLFGAEALQDQVGDVRFEIGPTTFAQPNLPLAARVYEEIRRRARLTGREAVYDLYSGAGLIALTLAGAARAVCGVESERENIVFAERHAALNGITNVGFLWGRLEDLLRGQALFKAGPAPELVVLDPPRAGLHPTVPGPLLQARPARLIYLSCNPNSLARDLKILLEREPALAVESLQMFDFFPHTAHLEALAVLSRC